jgi:channel protein (hemolysin III family)
MASHILPVLRLPCLPCACCLCGVGEPLLRNIALCIYGLSLVGMLTTSGIYHSVIATPAKLEILRKLDHAAIYLLIAGTYTPFCLIAFSGFWRWGMLTLIWSLALVGIVVKVFVIRAPRWVTAGVYVLMGWLCLLAVQRDAAALDARLDRLVAGWRDPLHVGCSDLYNPKGQLFPGRVRFPRNLAHLRSCWPAQPILWPLPASCDLNSPVFSIPSGVFWSMHTTRYDLLFLRLLMVLTCSLH